MSTTGLVTTFDARRGDGTIVDDSGTEFYFHCVEITDGTRDISVATSVSFERSVGLLGRDEARRVSPR